MTLRATLATAALAALAAGTMPAMAATVGPTAVLDQPPVVVSLDASPGVVVLRENRASNVVLTAHVTDDLGVTSVRGLVYAAGAAGEGGAATVPMERISGTPLDGVYRTEFRLNPQKASGAVVLTFPTGDKLFDVEAYDAVRAVDSAEEPAHGIPDRFRVVRDTKIRRFSVSDPTRAGGTVTLHGRLLGLTGGPTSVEAGYTGLARRTLTVTFQPTGTSVWLPKGELQTAADGRFRSSDLRARRDGYWRVAYAGSARFDKQLSRSVAVDVP